ncbi:IS66 family insertion sequence element accessory protein TnpA, partial [Myroides odoratimimus]
MSKQEIMYSHVEDWQASGLTQSKYCESVGIK